MSQRPYRYRLSFSFVFNLSIFLISLLATHVSADIPSYASAIELATGEKTTINAPGLIRFLVGNPDILSATQSSTDSILLEAQAPGRTFVHVWDLRGRSSMVVRILPVHLKEMQREQALDQSIEHAKSLKVGYSSSYELVHSGPTFSEADRNTLTDLRHSITHEMETPFGITSSRVDFQRINSDQELSFFQGRLSDGHIGPFEHLYLFGGDNVFDPFYSDSFAQGSISHRGAMFDYRGIDLWRFSGFWGRQRFGAFLPIVNAEAEQDVFFYGLQTAFEEPNSPWLMKASALFGYGDDRLPTQSDNLFDLVNVIKLSESGRIENELALSEGDIGYTLGYSFNMPDFQIRSSFRDISEDFDTIVGSASRQGEIGLLTQAQWDLTDRLSFYGRSDIYRSRLFPNPAEPDTLNFNTEFTSSLRPWQGAVLSGFISRYRNLGLLSPNDNFNVGGALSHVFFLKSLMPFLSTANVNSRYEHRESQSINTPSLDFNSEVVSAALSVPLFWGFTASIGEQWNFLEETLTGNKSTPRRFTAGLSHFSMFDRGRWQLRGRFSYEDESNSGSIRSFLSGQDRLVWEAGSSYRPSANAEYSLNGRVERVSYESSLPNRVEFAVFAMTRLLFDTGIVRWDPSATVRGVVFHDLNGDGILQPGEKGIESVKLTAGLKKSVLTDSKGRFVFRRIFGKSVPISIDPATIPKGYVFSTPAFQTIYPGKDTMPVLLFGALGRAEIRGRVFYDIDGDGQYSVSDRGIDNVRVQLSSDTAKTDRSGWFFFRGLASGSYMFSLMLESLPLPYLPLVPVRQPVELAEGDIKFIDIPVMMRRILSGRVYLDRNQNRQFDIGEEPLSGISICLDGKSAVSTDAQGVFRFPELAPGHHQLMLNCGMPMDDMVIFSVSQPVIEISPDDPEMITVDFRLHRKSDLVDEIVEELRKKKKGFTEL